MVRLSRMLQKEGLEIVAVSEDNDPKALRKFMAAEEISFPVCPDPGKKIYSLYRATGVPETHLIDKKGIIRSSQIGPFDWTAPEVVSKVRGMLKE